MTIENEPNLCQFAGSHKLNSFSEFTILKPVGIYHFEFPVFPDQIRNPVHPEYGRIIILVLINIRFFLINDICLKIKVILGKHYRYRFNGTLYRIMIIIYPQIINICHLTILYEHSKFPQCIQGIQCPRNLVIMKQFV